MPTGSRALWLVLAAILLGIAVADSDDGNGQVARLDDGLGEGRRGKSSATIRRTGLQTTGQFTFAGGGFQGNFEEELGEGNEGGKNKLTLGEAGPGLMKLTVIASSSQIAAIKNKAAAVLGTNPTSAASAAKSDDASWQGSFNVTHGKAQPATDGKLEATTLAGSSKRASKSKQKKTLAEKTSEIRKHCLTQIPVMGKFRNESSSRTKFRSTSECTSCKPHHYLQLRTHPAMTGTCLEFSPEPVLHCAPLGGNVYRNDWSKGDRICTKAALVKQLLKVSSLEDAEAKKHFTPLLERKENNKAVTKKGAKFFAYCNAWKQVVCQGHTCRVKKDVKCVKACKKKDSKCSADYCKGRFGAPACKEMAMAF